VVIQGAAEFSYTRWRLTRLGNRRIDENHGPDDRIIGIYPVRNNTPLGLESQRLEFLTGFTWTRQDGFWLKWIFSHFDHGIRNLPSEFHCVDGSKTSQFLESRQLGPECIPIGDR